MQLLMTHPWLLYAIVGFLGLCFGSLISLLSYRLPRDLPVGMERSRCPHCNTALKSRDLIPLLSFLFARAKCRYCAVPLSWRYPAIELLTGAAFIFTLWLHGPTIHAALLMGLAVCVITLIVTDLEHYIISDEVQIAIGTLAVADIFVTAKDWQSHLIAALLAGGLALGLRVGFRALRKKEGLGLGDVKLFAVAGLWLGLDALPVFILMSGLIGIVSALIWRLLGRGEYFPFGPALAMALWIGSAIPYFAAGISHFLI